MDIKVGDNVIVIKMNERYFHKVGRVLKIINTTKEQLYLVEFESGYEYYKKNDIAYR